MNQYHGVPSKRPWAFGSRGHKLGVGTSTEKPFVRVAHTCICIRMVGTSTSLSSKHLKTSWASIYSTGRYSVGASPHTCGRPTYWLTDAFWLLRSSLLNHGAC